MNIIKVVAFNGSPKSEGNTYQALNIIKTELEKEEIEVEIIQVGNKEIRGCLACNECAKNQNERCIIEDEVNAWIQKMKNADGIILGSPVHYAAIAGTMKSFLDRAFYVASNNGMIFRHKVGAPVVAVRRSGGLPTFNQLSNYLNYSEMMIPTSNYWNVIHGTSPGDALQDKEGKQIMRVLAKNMAYLMKLIKNGENEVEAPEQERKEFMNFIR